MDVISFHFFFFLYTTFNVENKFTLHMKNIEQ